MIFLLDENIQTSVEYLDDRCLRWQIRNLVDILCSVHYTVSDNQPPKRPNIIITRTSMYCRWVHWALHSQRNYTHLCELLNVSLDEHVYRFHDLPNCKFTDRISKCMLVWKSHFTAAIWCNENVPLNIPEIESRGFRLPIIIPKQLKMNGVSREPTDPLIYDIYKGYYNFRCSELLKCKTCKQEIQENVTCPTCDNKKYILKFNLEYTKREKPEWVKQDYLDGKYK